MDALLSIFLPVSLGVIMLSLGLGLTVGDFVRIIRQPRALLAGFCAQVLLIPLVAYGFVTAFGLQGELAFGVMILALCPGGVTSNILTKLVGGTLALSISLTGLISLISVITVPILVVFWAGVFMSADSLKINITSLALAMFMITAVPVILGMVLRAMAPGLIGRMERTVSIVATVLFVVIIIGAIAGSWDTFTANLGTLGTLTFAMVATLMACGWAIGRLLGLTVPDRAAIAMETGIQNGTLGIALAGIIHTGPEALPIIALPAAMYSVMMYLGALPAGYLMHRATKRAA